MTVIQRWKSPGMKYLKLKMFRPRDGKHNAEKVVGCTAMPQAGRPLLK